MNLKISFGLLAALILAACSTSGTQAPPTLTPHQQQGQAVFNLRCAQCHATVPDTIVIGPSLYGIATRAETRVEGYDAEAYLERSILVPDFYIVEGFTDTMPTNFGRELTSEELSALVSYLMTLK
ncbi:MAG: cytochrome c [Anaerolineales bacterium]|nr:cytochrome c [Anaerolineales bacterium]